MDIHVIFAKISWYLLIGILTLRPLADITCWRPFLRLMKYRKPAGIACGLTALLHVSVFLFSSSLLSRYFFSTKYWSFDSLWGWGNLALLFMLFPLLTSNRFSQFFLKRNWKRVQELTYPAFIATAIHVSFAKGQYLEGLLPLFIWGILWILAEAVKTNKQAHCEKLIN